jgi:PAS domain S-box-containing protein
MRLRAIFPGFAAIDKHYVDEALFVMESQRLADLSSDALLAADAGRVVYANAAAHRLFASQACGHTIVGCPLDTLWHPNPLQQSNSPEAGGTLAPIRVRGRRVDGREFDLELNAAWTGPTQVAVRLNAPDPTDAMHELAVLRATMTAERARAELFRAGLDEVSESLSLVDPITMQYVDFNDAACRLRGATRAELMAIGPAAATGLPADELRAKYRELIARHPEMVVEEHQFTRADGTAGLLESTRRALNVEGRWLVIVVARDVTERIAVTLRDISEGKRSQARLERFASALDLSADALFLIDRKTLTYLDFNESACRLMGVSRAELMARSPSHACITLNTQENLGQLYDRVISQAPNVLEDELSVTRADGTKVSCEVHRQGMLSEGRWVILANVRDITDRKEQQARLQRFASVVNMSADAVFLIEREGMRILDVNDSACRLYRYERAELLNLPLRRTMRQGPCDIDIEQQYDDLIAVSPRITRTERLQVRSDGTSFPAESQAQAILSGGKWIIAITVRDVTEQHRAAEELSQRVSELTRSNEELAQYAYVISHDLSEPLRAMSSYTQLLERRYAPKLDDDAREFMGYIVSGAHRMKRLIDDLLSYAQAGRSDVPIRPAPLETALNDALANLSSAIERAGATVERGELPDIFCDKSMAQVFQNLIGNALKFRGEAAPHIRVAGADEGDSWLISVQDNGIGIEAEYFKRIFVLFQRLHPRVKYEGTGIGLSICKKIVERHGGQISVESVPGQGACFSIRLPKTAHADADD